MQNIVSHSNKGEIPFIFIYITLLISSILILILLINTNFPKVNYSILFHSCFLNSFEGDINCKFPNKLHVYSNGKLIYINNKIKIEIKTNKINCSSNSFMIKEGEIKCGKMY